MTDRVVDMDKPNGPVAAVMLAGGIGIAAIGVVTTLSAASESFAQLMAWNAAVGPLTGKALTSTAVFFIAWLVLHLLYRGKEVNFNRIFMISMMLVFIGLLGTFPPFFELFAAE